LYLSFYPRVLDFEGGEKMNLSKEYLPSMTRTYLANSCGTDKEIITFLEASIGLTEKELQDVYSNVGSKAAVRAHIESRLAIYNELITILQSKDMIATVPYLLIFQDKLFIHRLLAYGVDDNINQLIANKTESFVDYLRQLIPEVELSKHDLVLLILANLVKAEKLLRLEHV